MLALNESGLVPPHGPVKLSRGAPSLFGRQAAERGNLFRTRLFVRRHGRNVAVARPFASEIGGTSLPEMDRRSRKTCNRNARILPVPAGI
jgi:hypothetical protein